MTIPQPDWINLPAKHTSPRNAPVRLVVLHRTCGAGNHNDTLYLAGEQGDGRRVSVDFTVERNGAIYKLNPQLAQFSTWHAGRNTAWMELRDDQVNHASIGIEIVQADAVHDYPEAQVAAVAWLCAWLLEHFLLPDQAITTHAKIIADGSRGDPEQFPFADFWREVARQRAHDALDQIGKGGAALQPVLDLGSAALYTPPAETLPHLGRIAALVRVSPRLTPPLQGLEHMCLLPGAVYFQSDLDLDTDGKRDPSITYDRSHQDEVSIGGEVDANVTPYFVLPIGFGQAYGIRKGDVAAVLYRDRIEFAVLADRGPSEKIGEGSTALHRSLGFERVVAGRIRDVGIDHGVITIVFPGSGNGHEQTPDKIRVIGREKFLALGGVLA